MLRETSLRKRSMGNSDLRGCMHAAAGHCAAARLWRLRTLSSPLTAVKTQTGLLINRRVCSTCFRPDLRRIKGSEPVVLTVAILLNIVNGLASRAFRLISWCVKLLFSFATECAPPKIAKIQTKITQIHSEERRHRNCNPVNHDLLEFFSCFGNDRLEF